MAIKVGFVKAIGVKDFTGTPTMIANLEETFSLQAILRKRIVMEVYMIQFVIRAVGYLRTSKVRAIGYLRDRKIFVGNLRDRVQFIGTLRKSLILY